MQFQWLTPHFQGQGIQCKTLFWTAVKSCGLPLVLVRTSWSTDILRYTRESAASGQRSRRHWHFSMRLQAATRCHSSQTVGRSLLGGHGRHILRLQTPPCTVFEASWRTEDSDWDSGAVCGPDRTSELQGVDAAKRYLFSKKSREIENIPPTAALLEHTKRGAFQAGHIWGQCLVVKPFVPSPGDWGWEKCDGQWGVVWTTLPTAAKACYELLSCKCQKTCKGNCKCHRANLQCTSLCACAGQCYGNWVNCEAYH